MKAGRITMIQGKFIQINQDSVDEASFLRCKAAAEDQSKGDYTLNIKTKTQQVQLRIQKFQYDDKIFLSGFIKQKYCSYFNRFENIDVKDYYIDTTNMSLFTYYDDWRIFRHLLLYWYTGLFKIESACIYQAIQLALHFYCHSLIQEIYKKLELVDFEVLCDDKSIEFLTVHLTQNKLQQPGILTKEQCDKLFLGIIKSNIETFWKTSNENTTLINKGYQQLTPDLFELILKKLISMEELVLQKIAQMTNKNILKKGDILEILHKFFFNYLNNSPQNFHSLIRQIFIQNTKQYYKSIDLLSAYSQGFSNIEILEVFKVIQLLQTNETNQIKNLYKDVCFQKDELMEQYNKLLEYSECFHLVKSTECHKHHLFFEAGCGHKVCKKCFLEYVFHKNNSYNYQLNSRVRCLSRYTDPSFCGYIYDQQDYLRCQEGTDISQSQIIQQE